MKNNFANEVAMKNGELSSQRRAMLKHGVEITLRHLMVEMMESHEAEINRLIVSKASQKALQNCVAIIIVEATDGMVRVPYYASQDDKTSVTWVYTGTHWADIPDAQLFLDRMRDACRKMGLWEDYCNDNIFGKKLRKQVEYMLSSYTRQPDNENVVLVNFLNGTLEISREGTCRLRPHCREDYFLYVLPYQYDPDAQCPRFQRYFNEVLPDPDAQKIILEYVASCFVPWLHLEKVLTLLGSGANGKSVLLYVITQLFGKTNVAHENIYDLTHDEVHRANIEGKLIDICTENSGKIRSDAFKTLASREPISCKRLYSQPYTMTEYARLLFSFNDMPKIESSYATMRRWLPIKFETRFSDDQADTELGEKLVQELPGIMNMVLGVLPGLLERKKFSKSAVVEKALQELEFHNNPVQQFVEERCEPCTVLTKGSELFKAFREFCDQNNYRRLSNQEFYHQLEEKYDSSSLDHQKAFYLRVARYED